MTVVQNKSTEFIRKRILSILCSSRSHHNQKAATLDTQSVAMMP